nr:MAG TPA: hypothetical protein [Caudoviricetes sp.]
MVFVKYGENVIPFPKTGTKRICKWRALPILKIKEKFF